MKKLQNWLLTAALLCGVGCNTWTEQDTLLLLGDITDLTELGVTQALIDEPQTEAKFTKAANSLHVLEQNDVVNYVDLIGIIQTAEIDELKSANGEIYFTVVKMAVRRFGGEIDVSDVPNFKRVVIALRVGLDRALGIERGPVTIDLLEPVGPMLAIR